MPHIPRTTETQDDNYNTVRVLRTPAQRLAHGQFLVSQWETRAAEFEASADRWAAGGAHDQAARNIADAKGYRATADAIRAEMVEIAAARAEEAPVMQAAAE